MKADQSLFDKMKKDYIWILTHLGDATGKGRKLFHPREHATQVVEGVTNHISNKECHATKEGKELIFSMMDTLLGDRINPWCAHLHLDAMHCD